MKSIIYAHELIKNLKRQNAANKIYYPAGFKRQDGRSSLLLFTEHEIRKARERADKNPEDSDAIIAKELNDLERRPFWKFW